MGNYSKSFYHISSFLQFFDICCKLNWFYARYYRSNKYNLGLNIKIRYFSFTFHDSLLFFSNSLISTFNNSLSFEKSFKPESAFAPITTKPPTNFLACKACFLSLIHIYVCEVQVDQTRICNQICNPLNTLTKNVICFRQSFKKWSFLVNNF